VVSVFPNRGRKLQTTRSWQFMRLERDGDVPPWSAWETARYGEDTIIGNLDSGVWPESKSFGEGEMGLIPDDWKGICQNEHDASFHCNKSVHLTDFCSQINRLLVVDPTVVFVVSPAASSSHRRALLQQGLRGGRR